MEGEIAERVTVIVDAKDNASGVLRGITAQMGALGGTVEQLTGTSINWGNVATQAARMISDAMRDAFKVATEYASAVRDLSLASGTTAEESSRLLQVLDDFEIKANDVTAATKALTRNGLAPTVETIAQLSDQYLLLNSAEERNAFITENLGRGGAKWANVLKEGSAAILEMNDSVNASLILNDEQIRQYEEMRLNQDALNDSWMALQVSFVNSAVPVLNRAMEELNENISESGTGVGLLRFGFDDLFRAIFNTSKESDNAAASQDNLAGALSETGGAAASASIDLGRMLSIAQRLNDATREQISLAGYQALQDAFSQSDGIISPEEAAILNEAGQALGVFDAGAAKSASSILTMAAAVDAGTASVEAYIAMLNSIPTSITTTISAVTVTGTQGSLLAGDDAYNNPDPYRADGGPVTSGETYVVGERGPELFTPNSSGSITPNEKMGNTYNIYGNVNMSTGGDGGFMDDR